MNQTIKEIGKKIVGLIPSKIWLSYRFKKKMGYPMDWKDPKTFNEKLQWLKLYDRNPLYTTMVDKYAVKKYVADQIGEEYVIPTLGVWDSFDEIDFDALPDQFVLKCTHDSGGLIIVKDKAKLDKAAARKTFRIALNRNPYDVTREWPYKNVSPRIIAEKFLYSSTDSDLKDYKIHCFNGEPKLILVCAERFSSSDLRENFYDISWNLLPVKRPKHPNTEYEIKPPKQLDKMLALAKVLSSSLPFSRVDFYENDGQIYFGEITFFPSAGMVPFVPNEWDNTFGSWITLPSKK